MTDKTTDIEQQQAIVSYLIHNQLHYKDLVKDLTQQLSELLYNEDPVFHRDVERNYLDLVKQKIIADLTSRLPVTVENAIIILEGLNIREFLK